MKQRILDEIEDGTRTYPGYFKDYGQFIEDEEAEYDIGDDPNAIDAATLGTVTITYLKSKFYYEWDPNSGTADPNLVELQKDNTKYLKDVEIDNDGVEIGYYDPVFGPSSNPMDTRAIRNKAILGSVESFMIDSKTRDSSMLAPQFPDTDDPEIDFNEDAVTFRHSLEIMETCVDPFLPGDMIIPQHVAKWHGYPDQMYFEQKPFTNNRFTTDLDNMTDFDSMDPHRARVTAVELARAKNAEWLPHGVSQDFHKSERAPFNAIKTVVGSYQKGEIDDELLQCIQPALWVLGSCVDFGPARF